MLVVLLFLVVNQRDQLISWISWDKLEYFLFVSILFVNRSIRSESMGSSIIIESPPVTTSLLFSTS